jgi:hypothetical protein
MEQLDPTGETHYLLGLACFHQQEWARAKTNLEASLRSADNELVRALLARVKTNLKTGVERAVDPLPDFDPAALRRPAAEVLLAPKTSGEPLPPGDRESLFARLAGALVSRALGALTDALVVIAWALRDRKALFDFESWDRRGKMRGLLELGGRRHQLNTDGLQSTYEGSLVGGQPPGQRRPEWTERFRTATGAWTTDDPMEGAAGTEIQRSGSPLTARRARHQDRALPGAREVSRRLLAPHAERPRQEVPFLNLLTIAWIQAQLHDWVSHRPTPIAGIEKIELAADDPLRSRYGIAALQVQKSAVNGSKPLAYLNEVTHWWDASHIYGSDEKTLARLRAESDGKLRIDGDLLPLHPETGIEDTGFARNWWIGLDLIHTLFVRHHNYICDRLKEGEGAARAWTSDELFHTARLINAAIMAKIQTVEWTPAALPNAKVTFGMATNWWGLLQASLQPLRKRRIHQRWEPRHPVLGGIAGGSRDNFGKPYGMSEEFTEVYRLHAGLPDGIHVLPIGAGPPPYVPTDATRGTAARPLMQAHGMATLLNAFGHQHMPALVNNNYPAFLCEMSVPGQPVIDLGTVDIFRARERGVPPYNEFRRMLGLKPIARFEDLGCSAETVETLESLYGAGPEGVEKLDLLAGTSCELWRPENFGFGETMFTVFIQMASRRLQADPFYTDKFNHRYYTRTGMKLIDEASFKGVLLQHYPELERTGLCNVENAFEPWGTSALERPEEHPLTPTAGYTGMQIRLRDPDSGRPLIVDTAARKVYAEGADPGVKERALSAACEYSRYFVRAVPGTTTPEGRFLVRGGLTRAEATALAQGRPVRAERTALELHLDFFDADGDARITLPENYRGWRVLGFSRFSAAFKALFSALVFGGYAIDIERIGRRRRKSTGVFDRGGALDEAQLASYLAEFDAAGGELGFEALLETLRRHSAPGVVSRAQFRSFFAVCRRMNSNRSVITKGQFVGLFDGSLLWQAASMAGSAGRRTPAP